jgi:hypothetical protein
MQSPIAKSPADLAGYAKDRLPKLTKAERTQAKQYVTGQAIELDPVVALRLALLAKVPLKREWINANVIDLALSTVDIAKRARILTERKIEIFAEDIVEVLERRARFEPHQAFRALYALVVPKATRSTNKKQSSSPADAWDEPTAWRALNLIVRLVPILLKGQSRKVSSISEKLLETASQLVVGSGSSRLAVVGIRLIVDLDREVGWAVLESDSLRSTVEILQAVPSMLVTSLLRDARILEISKLSEQLRERSSAETEFKRTIADLHVKGMEEFPLASKVWANKYLNPNAKNIFSTNHDEPIHSSAAHERLALILLNSWDARDEGERSAASFSLTEEVLRNGFNLYLGTVGGPKIPFDPDIHESMSPLKIGETVRLIRPWVELRNENDIQIVVKGIVEPSLK